MNIASNTEVHRWRAFVVLAVAFFMTIVDLTIVKVALPTIGHELHFSESSLQWVVTAYGLTFGGFLLLGGRAADLLGRRRMMMAGLALFTVASLGAGLATSDGFLIAMRGLQGLGAAVVLPAALSIVMNMFSEGAERNKALGIWGGIGALGATVGLIAGGFVTRYVGWQYIFFLNVPIGAAALLVARRIVPESRLVGVRRRFDALGAVSVTGGLLALVYAISSAPQVGWAGPRTLALLAVSAVLAIVFLVVESRVESPLMPLRIFRLRTAAASCGRHWSRCTATSGARSPARSLSPERAARSASFRSRSAASAVSPSGRPGLPPACSTPRSNSAAQLGSRSPPPSPPPT